MESIGSDSIHCGIVNEELANDKRTQLNFVYRWICMLGQSAHSEDGIVGLYNNITDFLRVGEHWECVQKLFGEVIRDFL